MFDLTTGHGTDCTRLSRRQFLRIGGLSAFGLGLPQLLRAQENAASESTGTKKTVNCILLWMQGGPSHIDMFDPKPDAPAEIRGEFGTVPTTLPGIRLSEHLPLLARQTDKFSIIRGHDPKNGSHGVADHLMMTGHMFNAATPYPCFGSVVAKERGYRDGMFPFVQFGKAIDRRFNGGIGGFLGDQFNPFEIPEDPNQAGFKVRDLSMHDGITQDRFEQRRNILSTVDEHFRTMEKSDSLSAMDSFYQSAYSLVSSAPAREAFNLAAEPESIRNEYGPSEAGQRMLMARRLVEAGVRFVSLTYGGWDMHQGIAKNMERQLPNFDQGFAALITDLDRRGMLDKTLVMVSSEFGRTPKINKDAGRDHWPRVFSVAFAGGGFKRGFIHGASDPTGGEPDSDPFTVGDLAATVFTQLGINPEKRLMSPGGRPQAIVRDGQVVSELLA
jgi:hypothetical protein